MEPILKAKTRLYLLFNHTLTSAQEEDAYQSMNIEQIVPFPDSLLEIWKNIPFDLPSLKEHISHHMEYLDRVGERGDFLLVQGDFGATYLMVQKAISIGMIPLYATTQRKSSEDTVEGKIVKTSVFEHGIFRRYGV